MGEAELAKDRELRDRAHSLFTDSLCRLRADMEGTSIAHRVGDRLVHGAIGVAEDATEMARAHPGKLAAAGVGVATWFARKHISGFLADHMPFGWFGSDENDESNGDGGVEEREEVK